jgi:hypothetical protein
MNAEYMVSSLNLASKSTLMIPNNFFYDGVKLDSRMLDKILYIFDKINMLL